MLLESYIVPQGVLAFYLPGYDEKIILIHPEVDYVEAPVWSPTITKLYYSIIDMTKNNGLGKVVEKSIPFLTDTLAYGKITAIKHGNGRDWWIIANEANSNSFIKILLNANGLNLISKQKIGANIPLSLGQAVFSPDGTRFATVGSVDDVQGNFLIVYNFDRCSGELSNPIQYNWEDPIPGPGAGISISPNSRYLYTTSNEYIYQYDLFASNLVGSKQTVAIYDGYQSPFGSDFYLAQLAPDNKIYINCTNGETVMHVIHNPDLPGLACNVEQHGIQLPCYNAQALPNFPMYRLGKWLDSPCDSLISNTTSEALEKITIKSIYPNPASTFAQIEFNEQTKSNTTIILGDMTGRQHLSETIPKGTKNYSFSLENCPSGWYVIMIIGHENQILDRQKLAIIRI